MAGRTRFYGRLGKSENDRRLAEWMDDYVASGAKPKLSTLMKQVFLAYIDGDLDAVEGAMSVAEDLERQSRLNDRLRGISFDEL